MKFKTKTKYIDAVRLVADFSPLGGIGDWLVIDGNCQYCISDEEFNDIFEPDQSKQLNVPATINWNQFPHIVPSPILQLYNKGFDDMRVYC